MPYPNYSPIERLVDIIVHVLGLGTALYLSVKMLLLSKWSEDSLWWSVAIYTTGLVLMLTASTTYHAAGNSTARPYLRRIDHAAIFLKIASTFTPLCFLIGSKWSYVVLVLSWGFAIAGALLKLTTKSGKLSHSWLPYAGLALFGLAFVLPSVRELSNHSAQLLALGGITYAIGLIFYRLEKMPFSNAIWHTFVVSASIIILLGVSEAADTGLQPS